MFVHLSMTVKDHECHICQCISYMCINKNVYTYICVCILSIFMCILYMHLYIYIAYNI